MFKKMKYFLGAGIILVLLLIPGCQNQETNNQEQATIESSDNTNPEKLFETRQVLSLNKHIYQILKFTKEDVSYDLEAGNKFFSSKDNVAVTVEIYEDPEISFDKVIETSMEYIRENITKQEIVSEDNMKIHYHVEYDIMGECKSKEVVCLKTKTGILLHDLTYFQAIDNTEASRLKVIIEEFLDQTMNS